MIIVMVGQRWGITFLMFNGPPGMSGFYRKYGPELDYWTF